MPRIFAKTAILPTGWAEDVRIEFDESGVIQEVDLGERRRPDDAVAGDQLVSILLPSPVNVHSHAFQRAMAGLTEHRGQNEGDDFWSWRKLMYKFLDRLTPDHVEAIAALVQMEMLEAGYSTNVEFHYLHHQPDGTPYENIAELSERIAAATSQTGIGLTLLPVHYQYGGCDQRHLQGGQLRFGNDLGRFMRIHDGATNSIKSLPQDCTIGIAPHSLRAVSAPDLQSLASMSSDRPIHIHVAEQVAEVEELLACRGKRPVEWLLDNVDLNSNWCLIHCTQMLPHETEALAKSGAVAGLCPITESNLGDGIFDGVRWISAEGRIAVGSDSNIRISLAEELRTLDYSQRLRDRTRVPFATTNRSSSRVIFDAAVKGGALAAGRKSGEIVEGAYADFLSLDSESIDLYERTGNQIIDAWIFSGDDKLVRDVWSAGRHVVKEGRHIEHDAIADRFKVVIRELLGS